VTVVRVPASTANLGAGFDAIGMALSIVAQFGLVGDDEPVARAVAADDHHPATIAFRTAGGSGAIWVRSPIPMGRGLGYSGAMRVGGAALAVAQRSAANDADADAAIHSERARIFAVAADLEGHADNVAASVYGGIVTTDGVRAIALPTPLAPDVVVWIPPVTTSTDASRTRLPEKVEFADAVFNVGRVATLVAALAGGDVGALREATADRIHQPHRLADSPGSAAALEAGLGAGAWCGWLSGSGPTVAFLVDRDGGAALAEQLPDDGETKVVGIDRQGVAASPTTPA
jgi:homoserine kinase